MRAWRVLAGLLALPPALLALLILQQQVASGFDPMGATFGLGMATLAFLGGWFATRGHVAESRARMRIALIAGFLVGGIAFAAGFFGPIVFAPDANQGPLLGIFFTGPLGFSAGVLVGWLVARFRSGRADGAKAPTASATRSPAPRP